MTGTLIRQVSWLSFTPAVYSLAAISTRISPMKTYSRIALGLVFYFTSHALLQAQNLTGQTVQTITIPDPTAYAVVSEDGNSSVMQRIVYELDANGNVIQKTHSYTEMATGLHYQQNGQWLDSKEEIDIQPNGTASATQGQHQAYFPGDLYNGQIELVTPDGLQLKSQPLGLSYYDGTNIVMFAVLTNSAGQVLGNNQVIYTNAFTGVTADLLYTYTKGGFEQDVILRQQPPTPESLGLNADTARLQIYTEFFSPPQPSIDSGDLPPQAGITLNDESLGFGQMQMVPGRAFLLGQNAQDAGAMVAKNWVTLEGRQFLVEEVPVDAIVDGLAALPLTAMSSSSSRNSMMASKHLKLPPKRYANGHSKTMSFAKAKHSSMKGLVLDYQTLNSSLTNYVFKADTTYYISGTASLYGTPTFEGGTVIKYASGASIQFNAANVPLWISSPYQPIVFTAKDDNSVGEHISGSSGSPSGYYATYALNFASGNRHDIPTFSNFRISYATTGIYITSSGLGFSPSPTIKDGQFVNCEYACYFYGVIGSIYNVLFANIATNFSSLNIFDLDMEQVTFANVSSLLSPGATAPGDAYDFENCIFANVGSFGGYSPGIPPDGLNNGFYNCPSTFGSAPVTTSVYPFQTVGAGSYYLTNGCAFLNAGISNIYAALKVDLAKKTTYPPIVYSGVSVTAATTLSPQAQRDTGLAYSLGYHYDPLDYVYSASYLYTNLTVTAGTAIGLFDSTGDLGFLIGLSLKDGANLTLTGTATQPCYVADHATVQEGGNGNWNNSYGQGGILIHGSGASPIPQINATFTKWPGLSAGDAHFQDPGGYGYSDDYGVASLNNCEFYVTAVCTYRPSYYFTNCLFFREQTTYWDQRDAASCTFQNCTFYNGFFTLCRSSGQSASFWDVQNTTFDGTAILNSDNYAGNTNYTCFSYNAYNTGNSNWLVQSYGYTVTNKLEVVSSHDVIVTNGYNWQSSWFGNFYLPTNSPLLHVGSTNANLLGLYHYTITTNQVVEGTNIVSIGYHYVATDAYGNPLDTNGDGIADYLEDANGNGVFDTGDLGEWKVSPFGLGGVNQLQVFTPLK